MTPEERAARVEEIQETHNRDHPDYDEECFLCFLLSQLDRVTAERDEYRLGAEVGNRIGTGAIRERDAALARMEMLREALTEATRHVVLQMYPTEARRDFVRAMAERWNAALAATAPTRLAPVAAEIGDCECDRGAWAECRLHPEAKP